MVPSGVLTLMTPDHPAGLLDGLLATPSSAKRQPLPEPPARMSSLLGMNSSRVLSGRLEPGPWRCRFTRQWVHFGIADPTVVAVSGDPR